MSSLCCISACKQLQYENIRCNHERSQVRLAQSGTQWRLHGLLSFDARLVASCLVIGYKLIKMCCANNVLWRTLHMLMIIYGLNYWQWMLAYAQVLSPVKSWPTAKSSWKREYV